MSKLARLSVVSSLILFACGGSSTEYKNVSAAATAHGTFAVTRSGTTGEVDPAPDGLEINAFDMSGQQIRVTPTAVVIKCKTCRCNLNTGICDCEDCEIIK